MLKFCKSFLVRVADEKNSSTSHVPIVVSGEKSSGRGQGASRGSHNPMVDLKTAQEIYQCPEFKAILNESQELQHVNLYHLKNDTQKLSFFINLHNLLCIHSHFFLASLNSTKCVDSRARQQTTSFTSLENHK